MIYRLLIPLVILSATGMIIHAVDRVQGYGLTYETYCLPPRPGPSADVLFVGSSRTDATVDTMFVEGAIQDKAGVSLDVAKIYGPGPDLIAYNVAVRKYLDEYDAPSHVFIETMYNVRRRMEFQSAHINRGLIPYVSTSTMLGAPARQYAEMTLDSPFNSPSAFLNREHTNVVELLTTRYLTGLYRFMKNPGESMTTPTFQCPPRDHLPSTRRQIYERRLNYQASTEPTLTDPSLMDSAIYKRAFEEVVPRNPTSPARTYENAALRALIDLFREAGTEHVYLVLIPTLTEVISDQLKADMESLYPDVRLIYLSDLYAAHPDLAEMYIDPFHFNLDGRLIISGFYADEVSNSHD